MEGIPPPESDRRPLVREGCMNLLIRILIALLRRA